MFLTPIERGRSYPSKTYHVNIKHYVKHYIKQNWSLTIGYQYRKTSN